MRAIGSDSDTHRDADLDSDALFLLPAIVGSSYDSTEALPLLASLSTGCPDHDQRKLFPTITGSNVACAQGETQARGHLAQCCIARQMPPGIIDGFEVIQVKKEQQKAALLGLRARDALFEP